MTTNRGSLFFEEEKEKEGKEKYDSFVNRGLERGRTKLNNSFVRLTLTSYDVSSHSSTRKGPFW